MQPSELARYRAMQERANAKPVDECRVQRFLDTCDKVGICCECLHPADPGVNDENECRVTGCTTTGGRICTEAFHTN